MVVVIVVGIFGLSMFFDSYTKHDEFVEVPNFEGFHYTEIESYLNDKNLGYFISDSVFNSEMPRGVVIEQQPEAGALVKPGRKIYLTINSVIPPSVLLPELKDFTVRQVVNKIPTYGLKIDSIIYKPAECDNCVIGVLYKGKEIQTGTRIEKGKSITIIVGQGIGNERLNIPYLYELSLGAARNKLNSLGLNLGYVEFDTTVNNADDSIQAFVFAQYPKYDTVNMLRQGQAIDLILTLDSNKLEGIELLIPDSLSTIMDSSEFVNGENE